MGEEVERFLFEIGEVGSPAFALENSELIGELAGALEKQREIGFMILMEARMFTEA